MWTGSLAQWNYQKGRDDFTGAVFFRTPVFHATLTVVVICLLLPVHRSVAAFLGTVVTGLVLGIILGVRANGFATSVACAAQRSFCTPLQPQRLCP